MVMERFLFQGRRRAVEAILFSWAVVALVDVGGGGGVWAFTVPSGPPRIIAPVGVGVVYRTMRKPSPFGLDMARDNESSMSTINGNDLVSEALAPTETIMTTTVLDESMDTFYDDVDSRLLFRSALIGIVTGVGVSCFKLSVDEIRSLCYEQSVGNLPAFIYPAVGGVLVGLLAMVNQGFAPGLKGTVYEVDEQVTGKLLSSIQKKLQDFATFGRKGLASVFTLGTGCSLGPEGTDVEIGMASSRLFMRLVGRSGSASDESDPPADDSKSNHNNNNQSTRTSTPGTDATATSEDKLLQEQRLLLSCGAAAGVSAGFNAPISGVFFALEIVQAAFTPIQQQSSSSSQQSFQKKENSDNSRNSNNNNNVVSNTIIQLQSLSSRYSITSILLASVVSAITSESIIGKELALSIPTSENVGATDPLLSSIQFPLFLVLGAASGLVAIVFSRLANSVKTLSDDSPLPDPIKPVLGGFICGVVGLRYPQVLFFGYETLNNLLDVSSKETNTKELLALLGAKIFTTAVCVGTGLVGGTFAPSLFFGALAGTSFHDVLSSPLSSMALVDIGDFPAYALVGAASTLAALYRAPLTASLLIFELTRDYEVILPLLSSSGVASLVGDLVEDWLEKQQQGEKGDEGANGRSDTLQQDNLDAAETTVKTKKDLLWSKYNRRRDEDDVSWGDLSDDMAQEFFVKKAKSKPKGKSKGQGE